MSDPAANFERRLFFDSGTAYDRARATRRDIPDEDGHTVGCIYCCGVFDLFLAPWCEHALPHPSKVCPKCGRCLCAHPMYLQADLWKEAPALFRRRGFRRLFVLYF
jgi:hypothetical protein